MLTIFGLAKSGSGKKTQWIHHSGCEEKQVILGRCSSVVMAYKSTYKRAYYAGSWTKRRTIPSLCTTPMTFMSAWHQFGYSYSVHVVSAMQLWHQENSGNTTVSLGLHIHAPIPTFVQCNPPCFCIARIQTYDALQFSALSISTFHSTHMHLLSAWASATWQTDQSDDANSTH